VVIQNGSTATVLDRLITIAGTGSAGHTLRIFERGNSAKVNFYSYTTFAKRTTPTNTDAIFSSLTYLGGSGESTFTNPTIAFEVAGAAGSSGSSGSSGSTGSSGSSGSSGQTGAAGSSGSSGQSGAAGSSGSSGSSGQSGAAGSSGSSGSSGTSITIANNVDNYVLTATGSGINGESGLTYSGSQLAISGSNTSSSPVVAITVTGTGTFQRGVRMLNSGMNAGDHIMYALGQADGARNMGQFYFQYNGAGSTTNRISMGLHSVDDVFNIAGTGNVGIGITTPSSLLEVYNGDFKINDTYRIGWRYTAGDSNMYNWITNSYSSGIQYKSGSWTSGQSILCHDFQTYSSSAWQSRLSILQNGNIGIGNTSPGNKLLVSGAATDNLGLVNINNTHSAGDIMYPALQVINDRGNHSYGIVAEFRIASTTDGDRPSILFSKGGTGNNWSLGMGVYAGSHDNFSIGYRSSYYQDAWATGYLTISTGGNVGIGTNSPDGKLHVFSSATTGGIRVGGGNGSGNSRIFIEAAGNNSYIDSYGDSTYKPLSIEASPLRLNKSSSGQVVIGGDTSSGTTLMYDAYVDGSSAYYHGPALVIRMDSSATGAIDRAPIGLFIHNNNGSNNSWTKLSLGNREASGAGNTVSIAGIAARKTSGTANAWASGDLHLWTKSGGTQVTNMVLKSSGNVGIGTDSPGSLLDVRGKVNVVQGGRTLSLGDGSYSNHILCDSNVDFAFNYNNGSTGGFGFFGGTSGAKFMCSYTGTLTVAGDLIAYGSPSDSRLKIIKEKIPNALDSVLKLNGYRFDWKEKENLVYGEDKTILHIKEDIGVIAQEVAQVLPELSRINDDGYMSVRYQGLTAVLIEAIKEQQAQIESQKSQNEELAKRIETLESILQNKGI
jgi:hypothetical protein